MIQRVSGLVLIINTLMPLIFVVVFSYALHMISSTIENELSQPFDNMVADINSLKTEAGKAVDTINTVTTEVGKSIDGVGKKITKATTAIKTAGDNISKIVKPINKFAIPNPATLRLGCIKKILGVPVPTCVTMNSDIQPFKKLTEPFRKTLSAVNDAVNIGPEFKKALTAVKKLEPLAENFNQYKEKFGTYGEQMVSIKNAIANLGGRLGTLFWIILILLVPWIGVTYFLWSYQRIRTGWLQLKGEL